MTADLRAALLRAAGLDVITDGLGNVLARCAATGRQWQPITDEQVPELIGVTKS